MTSNGEPFHFLPTAPDVLFCKGSPSMKKVIMTIQPDLLQLASKRRQASAIVAPRVPTKKRKIIARWIIKKMAQSSPSPSDTNSNQVIHLFWNFFLIAYIYTLVDCNFISRTQLKTTLTLVAQYNMKPSFTKLILEQLKLPMLWQMCMMNGLT